MVKIINEKFSFLEKLEFSKSEASKGNVSSIKYSKNDMECHVSWSTNNEKPSLTFSSDNHLIGILDCEEQIRVKNSNLPIDKGELLAWIFSAMPLSDFLDAFVEKLKLMVNE